MKKQMFLHRKDLITGPFDQQTLKQMLRNGDITSEDKISFDKHELIDVYTALDIIVPDLCAEPAIRQSVESPLPPSVQNVQEAEQLQQDVLPETTVTSQPVEPTLYHILSDTVGALFASGIYTPRLRSSGRNTMTVSAVFAAAAGLLLTLTGGLLYCRFYELPPGATAARGMLWVLTSGAIAAAAATMVRLSVKRGCFDDDLMTAMHCMMHSGAILIIINAVMFLLNKKLFDLTLWSIFPAFFIASLAALFFLKNLFFTLYMNFSANAELEDHHAIPLSAAELVIMLISFSVIQYAVYDFN